VVNLDEQYLIKAHKQMLEQAEKDVDTALFQRTEQSQKDAIEQAEKFGLFAQMKEIEELAKLMTPQLFQSLNSEQQEDVIKVTEAISEPDTEPETHKEKVLKAKEVYQRMAQEPHDNFFNFETQWQCADEYRYRTDEGDFDTYMDAYRYAVKHCLADDKPIPSPERLVKAYKRAKDNCCLLKSQPDGYWNK
jgi:hypothetical protein